MKSLLKHLVIAVKKSFVETATENELDLIAERVNAKWLNITHSNVGGTIYGRFEATRPNGSKIESFDGGVTWRDVK
jgi:hypothetical protein